MCGKKALGQEALLCMCDLEDPVCASWPLHFESGYWCHGKWFVYCDTLSCWQTSCPWVCHCLHDNAWSWHHLNHSISQMIPYPERHLPTFVVGVPIAWAINLGVGDSSLSTKTHWLATLYNLKAPMGCNFVCQGHQAIFSHKYAKHLITQQQTRLLE